MIGATAEAVNEFNDFNPVIYADEIVRREATRYLFFPGDVIGARRKQERADLAAGGEEVGSACLVRTKGFLRRCRISPLERWGELMPQELLPEGAVTIGIQQTGPGGSEQGFTSFKQNLYAYPKYPGEEITWILQHADNSGMKKGIVELTALRAMDWKEYEKLGLQKDFFPEYPKLPVTLREVEEAIQATARRAGGNSMLGQMADEMLTGCAMFRRWATARIEAANILVRIGTTKDGWTYTYTDLDETLLPQLEMERVDHHLQNQARFQGTLADSQLKLAELIERAVSGAAPSTGVDTTTLITTIQQQMAEQQAVMMKQNQEFLKETLAKLFGAPEPADGEKPKPQNGDKKK